SKARRRERRCGEARRRGFAKREALRCREFCGAHWTTLTRGHRQTRESQAQMQLRAAQPLNSRKRACRRQRERGKSRLRRYLSRKPAKDRAFCERAWSIRAGRAPSLRQG